jgi:hypothetical protein
MAKKDFSILLEPAIKSTLDHKDVALVNDVYSIGQQIKNIVLSRYGERPFTPQIGVEFDITKIGKTQNIDLTKNKVYIKSRIEYLIKNIKNVKVDVQPNSYNTLVTVLFDYVSLTQIKSGNTVTITVNTK